jgi:hypothetical protein
MLFKQAYSERMMAVAASEAIQAANADVGIVQLTEAVGQEVRNRYTDGFSRCLSGIYNAADGLEGRTFAQEC